MAYKYSLREYENMTFAVRSTTILSHLFIIYLYYPTRFVLHSVIFKEQHTFTEGSYEMVCTSFACCQIVVWIFYIQN
jgi:hypothetical protein